MTKNNQPTERMTPMQQYLGYVITTRDVDYLVFEKNRQERISHKHIDPKLKVFSQMFFPNYSPRVILC